MERALLDLLLMKMSRCLNVIITCLIITTVGETLLLTGVVKI